MTEYDYTGAAQCYTVPAGVDSVTFSVTGGHGGRGGDNGGAGGVGRQVEATFSVTPGQTFRIDVGGNGSDGTTAKGAGTYDVAGGWNGGGRGGGSNGTITSSGGGGGGASDVVLTNTVGSGTLYVEAAGGGGGGGYGGSLNPDYPAGGTGGGIGAGSGSCGSVFNGGSGGAAGHGGFGGENSDSDLICGGGGGGMTSGGADGYYTGNTVHSAGANTGDDGACNNSVVCGGSGLLTGGGGGGGGGGYFGGGGGGDGSMHSRIVDDGAGGGGGSNYGASSASDFQDGGTGPYGEVLVSINFDSGNGNAIGGTGSTGGTPAQPATPASSWAPCTQEGSMCSVSAPTLLAFGVSGHYLYQQVSANTPCTVSAFGGDPAPNVAKSCLSLAIPPGTGWTQCATEGGDCYGSGLMVMAFGANGHYVYTVGTAMECSNEVFGTDPAPNVVKSCYATPPPS